MWWKARLGGCWGRLLLDTGTLSPVSELSSTIAVPCTSTEQRLQCNDRAEASSPSA